MRTKINNQTELNFQPSNLRLTNAYYSKYEAVSKVLEENTEILQLVHEDLKDALQSTDGETKDGTRFKYTSDTVLRIQVCQITEGCSLREMIIRIDDSNFLRQFVRIYNGPMMDFTTFCRLRNCITPQTWEKVNRALAKYAKNQELIGGDELRLDTTAVETHIHWPSDSSLLWDTYRVLARLIEQARELDSAAVADRRLLVGKVKKLAMKIARKSSKKPGVAEKLKPLYEKLIPLASSICEWSESVREFLKRRRGRYGTVMQATVDSLVEELGHFRHLGLRVIDQATRRVLCGEQVPNEEKLFSIFEPHTELLKRGKTGKPIEFGHMIQIQQVSSKFITDYGVFERKPIEHQLVNPALESHRKLFGDYPDTIAADKGYYENMAAIAKCGKKVELVSIAKKGRRSDAEARREADPEFRFAQRFRAGVEGTISFLKRILGLFRCLNKGWEHYASTVGATIFTHNLLILARE